MIFTIKRILFTFCVVLLLCLIGYSIFLPLYLSPHVIIDYGIQPFDICVEQPILWKYCKYWFVFTYIFSSFFIATSAFHLLSKIPMHSHSHSSKSKSTSTKKAKSSYSLIEQPIPAPKLELLIRRN